MFGRRRHVAVVPAAPVPVPQLTDTQILELVHGKITELIGVNGEWTVSRRSAGDTDTLFHTVLAQSVSVGIAAAITDARRRLEAGEAESEPQHLADDVVAPVPTPAEAQLSAPVTEKASASEASASETSARETDAADSEPVAFSWEPAPITVWTDLRKPVSGSIPTIAERTAA